jgi:uncharacterized protein with gpF-like domain
VNTILDFRHRRPPRRFPRGPVQRLPNSVWEKYADALRTEIFEKWKVATQHLVERLPSIERQVEMERPGGLRTDAWSDDISRLLSALSDQYDIISKQSKNIAAGAFDAVNGISHRQWYAVAQKIIGVNLFQFEPWVATESKAFIHINTDLIVKIQSDVQSDISRIVMGGFREGKRWKTLRDEIMEKTDLEPGVFPKLESRAELIARDQCTKLYADVGEKRQVNAGITLYTWRTMEDERVVGTPGGKWPVPHEKHENHYKMNGKICRWDDVTVYADSVAAAMAGKWKKRTHDMPKLHAGKEIQCRCYSDPVFDTLFK